MSKYLVNIVNIKKSVKQYIQNQNFTKNINAILIGTL